jgi:threonine aldolase
MTKPTAEMRRFMCDAEVGDEQKGEDPTVNLLQEMTAELLGKEAALFLPSGTMCNQIAIKLHCRPGDEVLLDRTAHPLNSEAGGPAVLAGAIVSGLPGERGVFTAEQVRAAVDPSRAISPRRGLSLLSKPPIGGGRNSLAAADHSGSVCGGTAASTLHAWTAHGFNAVSAGVPAKIMPPGSIRFGSTSEDSGAPVGAVLAGRKDFILEAWQWKQRLGAPCGRRESLRQWCHALRHHVERLAEDHANAKVLAAGLAEIPGIALNPKDVKQYRIFDIAQTPA